MNLYVSNLAYDITDAQLTSAFAAFGVVGSARVINDRETGRSRGFGFVDMANDEEALAAIRALDGQDLGGRPLKVVEARPKEDNPKFQSGPPKRSGGGAPGGARPGSGGGYRDGGGGGGHRDGGRRDDWDRGGGGGGGKGRDRDRDHKHGRGGRRSGGEFEGGDEW